ncbi:MAG: tRNA pseudouridine(54/55) synthase Pus10 [archaeon]|jgi:tRNA pseudouridine synthase 10
MPRRLSSRNHHSFLPLPDALSLSWLYESPENAVTILISIAEKLSGSKEFSSFKVSFSWPKTGLSDSDISHLKRTVQYCLTKELEQKLGKKPDFRSPEAEFLFDFCKNRAFLRLSALYIEGKYCKFSRQIANTKKSGFESVESLLNSGLLSNFKSQFGIMHGAGREDTDVLMLGSGRPFVLELLQPEIRSVNLPFIEKEINKQFEGKISVNSLKFVSKSAVAPLKNTLHEKIYSALVSCFSKPNLKKLETLLNKKISISQRTPLRVSKRRSDLVRKKEVEFLEVKAIDEKSFELKLKTSHGTYVKEFISGDGGRTTPSVSSFLGLKCGCAWLDVLEISD